MNHDANRVKYFKYKLKYLTLKNQIKNKIKQLGGNLPTVEPTTKKFLESINNAGGKPLYEMKPVDARKVLDDLQIAYSKDLYDFSDVTDIEDVDIPFELNGKQHNFSIRIVRPKAVKLIKKSKETQLPEVMKLPIVMYFHGGGWVLGNKMTHNRLIREISYRANVAVVFVNYTPSPEGQYPVPLEQCYEATKYMVKNAQTYNLDSENVAVCGDSVGGNFVAVVALLAKQRGDFKIKYQVLMYPVTDASMSTKSYTDFQDGYWLAKKAMAWFWDEYAPDVGSRGVITLSPLNATIEDLRGLPPALLIVDENDVLRDEGEAYAHKLMEAGVDITAVRYLGTVHDFCMLNALANTPAPRSAISLVVMNLKERLMS
ncbi:MAG: alpha/beta hydrolase [Terrestrivirus sp.]|uniref:Alpha/beta hydrolase n=1 Tax=Terrestrivirus sp. TaxID=2487775 RepID=A0A3G4ZNN1_9VIRU|nr:MAG: alpha/beta hydrolase [Terrestrivirus sp.]